MQDLTSRRTTTAKRVAAAAAAALFIALGYAAARAGVGGQLAAFGLRADSLDAADEAARVTPSDPAAHYARAVLLLDAGLAAESLREAEEAVRLRPNFYSYWLRLALARESAGDVEGAVAAGRRAVELAPNYAGPVWQLGNTLLRAGRVDEAFVELGRAARRDPSLLPALVDLATGAYGGDAKAAARALAPDTDAARMELAGLFAKRGAPDVALELFRATGVGARGGEATRPLIRELIAAGRYAEAREVWASAGSGGALIEDGGFEGELHEAEDGFWWRFAREAAGVRLSIDAESPREGARSLKVEYAGASDPNAATVSQLIAAEPGARYRLTFSARTKDLVTGGPPYVGVFSAGKTGVEVASSAELPQGTTGWRDYSVDFTVPDAGAVRVELRRRPCASSPCPAFGGVWLDSFRMERLGGGRER